MHLRGYELFILDVFDGLSFEIDAGKKEKNKSLVFKQKEKKKKKSFLFPGIQRKLFPEVFVQPLLNSSLCVWSFETMAI